MDRINRAMRLCRASGGAVYDPMGNVAMPEEAEYVPPAAPMPRTPELRAGPAPSLRDRTFDYIYGMLGGTPDKRALAEQLTSLGDALTGFVPTSIDEGVREIRETGSPASLAMAVMPGAKPVGAAAKKVMGAAGPQVVQGVVGSSLGHNGGPSLSQAGTFVDLRRPIAPPADIERVARLSSEGEFTYPQLTREYQNLGLIGRGPNPAAEASLAAQHPPEAVQAAIDQKLLDRDALNALSEVDRKLYRTNKLKGFELPSTQIANATPEGQEMRRVIAERNRVENALDRLRMRGQDPTRAGFDTSAARLTQTPNVPQFHLPRAEAKITPKIETAFKNSAGAGRLLDAARRAPPENAGWYNMDQLRDVFVAEHGATNGQLLFDAYLDALAGTSMVNPVQNNIRSSTEYLGRVIRGEPLPQVIRVQDPLTGQTTQTLAGGPAAGYGAKSQIQHAARVREFLGGDPNPITNPKPLSYRTNLGGNWMPRTVDTHDIRNMIGMRRAKRLGENASLLPGEYAALERLGERAADRMGIPNAAHQALVWVGGGKYTGLKSPPVPMLQALNERLWITSQIRGIGMDEALRRMVRGEEALYARGGRVNPLPSRTPSSPR